MSVLDLQHACQMLGQPGHVLDQVKHSDATTNRRKKAGAVRSEEEVSFAIDCAQQVRELLPRLSFCKSMGKGEQVGKDYLEFGLHVVSILAT